MRSASFIRLSALFAALSLQFFAFSGTAFAAKIYAPTIYAGKPIEARIGGEYVTSASTGLAAPTGKVLICWRRITWNAANTAYTYTGEWSLTRVATSGSQGLTEHLDVYLGSKNDVATVDLPWQSNAPKVCNADIRTIKFNGYKIEVNGETGDDLLLGYSASLYDLFGGDGSDVMYSNSAMGKLYGDGLSASLLKESTNDSLYSVNPSASSFEGLSGGPGNDCLQDTSGSYFFVQGGAGTDTAVNVALSPQQQLDTGIEQLGTCCPNRFAPYCPR